MMQYVSIQIKDGNRITDSNHKKFKEVYDATKKEAEMYNSKTNTEVKVDISDNKIRIGIDVITAEDLLVLNQKAMDRLGIINLISNGLLRLLKSKSISLVVDKENA